MTEIADVVKTTVNVADTRTTQAGFGIPLIFGLVASSVFPERVREYQDIDAVAVDFEDTTKMYKAARAIFNQKRAPKKVKVGRRDAGDASHTTALAAIEAEDSDWYCLLTTYRLSSELQELAAWIEAKNKIFIANSQDMDVLTNVDTDIASILKAAGFKRTAYMWARRSGKEETGASYTVASGVATIGQTAHDYHVGDPITFLNSSGVSIDGNNTIDTVPNVNEFTVLTTAADEAGPATVDYFGHNVYTECAWAGLMLPSDPGSEIWKFKQLAGVPYDDKTLILPSEESEALSKNANLYTPLGGVGSTHNGTMASGRFIDVQRSIDWLEARIGEVIANRLLNEGKIPYTDAGVAIFQADISSVLDLALSNNVLGPLLDDSGDLYRINIPKVADQLSADRIARYFPGITVEAQLAGAVQSLEITVNAQV